MKTKDSKDGKLHEHCKSKSCFCGGHNVNNKKKNKKHHSTACRLLYRKGRQKDNLKILEANANIT